MDRRAHVFIAEPSVIIRSGIISVLKRLTMLNIDIAEISDISTLVSQLNRYKPDILIVDPSYLGIYSLQRLKDEAHYSAFKTIALQNVTMNGHTLKNYEGVISIYDSPDAIRDKMLALMQTDGSEEDKQELSDREKEVLVCVIKGFSNKQIADQLCISIHTVITHRRNIVAKLQIHSPAGMTIYAIVNKLVEFGEIKDAVYSE